MAGSYSHIVDKENNFTGLDCIDNLGDAWEALEECYDMIEYFSGGDKGKIALAHQYHIAKRTSPENAANLNLDGYFDDDAPIFNQEAPMSKQGKNAIVGKCEKCKGDLYMTHNGCCHTEYTCFDCGHFYEVDENQLLIDIAKTAEATAADYAKQAAELQEQNEELHRKLNHNCPYCPCKLFSGRVEDGNRLPKCLARELVEHCGTCEYEHLLQYEYPCSKCNPGNMNNWQPATKGER